MQSSNDDSWTRGLSLKQAALVAGFTCLLNPVTFAEAYAIPRLTSADPAETVRNLTAHPHLFSVQRVLSYVISAIGDVVMAWALFALLRPINRTFARPLIVGGRKQMSFWSKVGSHDIVDFQKTLGVLRRLKALHAALSLPGWLM